MESHTVPQQPTVSIDALETFVELLVARRGDPATDDFYSRLCEATCRLADMDRAVIFRYDGARRRVRAAGAYGIDLDVFADAQVNVETIQVARDSLVEDRVIEITGSMADGRAGGVPHADHATRRSCARRWPPRAAGWA